MKKILFLLIITFFFSCTKDEEEFQLNVHPNLGKYKLESFTSNIPLDLDRNNIKSTNFKNELMSVYFGNLMRSNGGILSLNTYNYLEKEVYLSTEIPKDNYNPEQFQFLRFGPGDYSKMLVIDPNSDKVKEIKHIMSNDFPPYNEVASLLENNYPVPYEVIFEDKNTVRVKIKQNYFDIEQDKWVLVLCEGVWKR